MTFNTSKSELLKYALKIKVSLGYTVDNDRKLLNTSQNFNVTHNNDVIKKREKKLSKLCNSLNNRMYNETSHSKGSLQKQLCYDQRNYLEKEHLNNSQINKHYKSTKKKRLSSKYELIEVIIDDKEGDHLIHKTPRKY